MLKKTLISYSKKEKLLLTLKDRLKSLFEINNIKFSFLYGSWVTNSANWWSDIDIAVYYPDYIDFSKLISLNMRAEELTGFEEINIKVIQNLPLHIQFTIFSQGEILTDNAPQKRLDYFGSLLPKYYDHIIWYKQMLNNSFI